MLFTRSSLVVLLCVLGVSAECLAEEGNEIVRLADAARIPTESVSFIAHVKNISGSDKQDCVYKVSVNGANFSLIEQIAPERLVGRKLLMRDRDLWLYTPNIKRATRIGFEQRLTGEVSNGDLARTNFANDYSATVIGPDTVEKKACTKLKLVAKSKDVTYSQIDYWVEKKTHYPVQAEFYALSGKALKTAVYSDFKPVLGHQRMTKIVIRDKLNPKNQSTLEYSRFKREKFTDKIFNKESLGE